jgi:oxygen-independent coproporphyrinogen III oxidase
MVEHIAKELALQTDYLNESVSTIYFGGGTPSLLDEKELDLLLNTIYKNFQIETNPEITLEANPDDLTKEKLKTFHQAGINRLSIGIQSFHDQHLIFLNRTHSANEAIACFHHARDLGFQNISLDLIYAIPAQGHHIWQKDLDTITDLKPEHVSSYCLTIEAQTAFGNWLKRKKIKPINEDFAAEQFEILIQRLTENGYEQYEISNFCLPEFYSRHNSSYWQYKPYLGVGPGAHSFNGNSRQSNINHNPKYIKALQDGNIPFVTESLSYEEQVNEYILTSLRTKWGCDLSRLKEQFHYDLTVNAYIKELIDKNLAKLKGNCLILTNSGKLLADQISSDLFLC